MYTIHEGEIVLKEKYGSRSKERLYIKPPDQGNIVILDDEKLNRDMLSWFTKIFLPQGYPESVSKDYMPYQIWDTAQAFCSTITGTLATQEVLRGVGVGDTSATPLAATITWVIKDGCGHLGKIWFAFSHGTSLDAYSKKWRLYADTLNDAAMCIEIALPLFKTYVTFALCASTVMKAIVGVAGGATRAAMTQHHAIRGNLADVSAKDSAQETAVNLVASFAALAIITLFGKSLGIFILMMVLHIVFNYLAVRAVCLRSLNEPRFLQVIDRYLKQEVIAHPCEINRNEPIIFYQLGPNLLDLKLCGFKIKLGYSIKKLIKQNMNVSHLRSIVDVYGERSYLLYPNISNREMYVLISDKVTTDDILCAYFHAILLSYITCALNDDKMPECAISEDPRPFLQVCRTLQEADWSREPAETVGFSGFVYEPSYDLMRYVDQIAQKEWQIIKSGLMQTGWDLSKHLLMVEEWRIIRHQLKPEQITKDEATNVGYFLGTNMMTFNDVLSEIDSGERIMREPFIIEPESTSEAKLLEPTTKKTLSVLEQKESKVSNSSKSVELNKNVYNSDKDKVAKPKPLTIAQEQNESRNKINEDIVSRTDKMRAD